MNTQKPLLTSISFQAFITGILLLIPLTAMQFTDEVVWTLSDFIFAGILIFGTGFAYTLITRKSGQIAYRVAIGFALLTGFFLIWVNAAVGIIGGENNPVNVLYFGVILIGLAGAALARFQPKGMAATMFSMAGAQALIAIYALLSGMAALPHSSVMKIIAVNGFFAGLFILSACLFMYIVQQKMPKYPKKEE